MKEIEFYIDIQRVEGNKFYGSVEDNNEHGGTPRIGTIEGIVKKHKISFTKQMPILTYILPDLTSQTFKDKKHNPIYYEGSFSKNYMRVYGTCLLYTSPSPRD